MNERIKQLAEQVDKEFNSPYDRYKAIERFAELIVRECLKIVEPDRTSGDEWCLTLDETAQSIRQHFGIKDPEE